jgi:L-ascorbate metabolism protein UlaG (beta-lactamase superfamily)
VVILPVDQSQHILSYQQANDVVARLNPKVIIPEHYLTKGASITLTTLGTAEEWTRQQPNHTLLDSATLKLSPESIKDMDKQVLYFGANHLKN